jgi:hypothetical protein
MRWYEYQRARMREREREYLLRACWYKPRHWRWPSSITPFATILKDTSPYGAEQVENHVQVHVQVHAQALQVQVGVQHAKTYRVAKGSPDLLMNLAKSRSRPRRRRPMSATTDGLLADCQKLQHVQVYVNKQVHVQAQVQAEVGV